MKKLVFLSFLFLLPLLFTSVQAQSLNSNAEHISENHPEAYQNSIRAHAIREWDNDHRMIVHVINQQADALFDIVNDFQSEHTQILFSAIQDWSHSGETSNNVQKFRDFSIVNVENMIELKADWRMVKHVYDRQTEASGAY